MSEIEQARAHATTQLRRERRRRLRAIATAATAAADADDLDPAALRALVERQSELIVRLIAHVSLLHRRSGVGNWTAGEAAAATRLNDGWASFVEVERRAALIADAIEAQPDPTVLYTLSPRDRPEWSA